MALPPIIMPTKQQASAAIRKDHITVPAVRAAPTRLPSTPRTSTSSAANPRGVAIASPHRSAPPSKPAKRSSGHSTLLNQVNRTLANYHPSGVQALLSQLKPVPSGTLGLPKLWQGQPEFGRLFNSYQSASFTKPPGMLMPGNIDIYDRPVAHNPDGSISTVRSITLTDPKDHAVLIPTVTPDGKVVSDAKAIALWIRTGQHLGIFKDEASANRYANNLHNQQASQYLP